MALFLEGLVVVLVVDIFIINARPERQLVSCPSTFQLFPSRPFNPKEKKAPSSPAMKKKRTGAITCEKGREKSA